MVEQVLIDATRLDLNGAAMAAAEVLGEIGDPTLLTDDQGGHPRPLTGAGTPNPRVRLAAARAIMQIDPHQPYPGAGNLTRPVGSPDTDRGRAPGADRDPRPEQASTVAGYFADWDSRSTMRPGRQNWPAWRPGIPITSFVLISDSIEGPVASEVIAAPAAASLHSSVCRSACWLRARTYSRPNNLPTATIWPWHFPGRPIATPLWISPGNWSGWPVEIAGSPQRVAQATEALQWLNQLAENDLEYRLL